MAERGAEVWYLADGKATKEVAAIARTSWYLKQAVFGVRRVKSCDEQEEWREVQFADVCLPLGREGCSQEQVETNAPAGWLETWLRGLRRITSSHWVMDGEVETPLFKTEFFGLHRSDPEASLVDLPSRPTFPSSNSCESREHDQLWREEAALNLDAPSPVGQYQNFLSLSAHIRYCTFKDYLLPLNVPDQFGHCKYFLSKHTPALSYIQRLLPEMSLKF